MPDVRTQQARDEVPNPWLDGVCGRASYEDDGYVRVPASDWDGVISCFRMGERISADCASRVAALETALRWELWINHGCPPVALYGDDGEMSCGMCVWDFKRSDVLDTIEYVKGARLKRAAEIAGAAESPETPATASGRLTQQQMLKWAVDLLTVALEGDTGGDWRYAAETLVEAAPAYLPPETPA